MSFVINIILCMILCLLILHIIAIEALYGTDEVKRRARKVKGAICKYLK